tara:strand:- start:99 stop:590 length:492 start_codon:yes stop_codon:yes gene_type:complete
MIINLNIDDCMKKCHKIPIKYKEKITKTDKKNKEIVNTIHTDNLFMIISELEDIIQIIQKNKRIILLFIYNVNTSKNLKILSLLKNNLKDINKENKVNKLEYIKIGIIDLNICNQNISKSFFIPSTPSLISFHNNKELDRFDSIHIKYMINFIDNFIKKTSNF